MTPQQFCTVRTAAIEVEGRGKKSKWTVLGSGHFGKLGAIRIRDGFGTIGLVIQKYPGTAIGMTTTDLRSYVEEHTL